MVGDFCQRVYNLHFPRKADNPFSAREDFVLVSSQSEKVVKEESILMFQKELRSISQGTGSHMRLLHTIHKSFSLIYSLQRNI